MPELPFKLWSRSVGLNWTCGLDICFKPGFKIQSEAAFNSSNHLIQRELKLLTVRKVWWHCASSRWDWWSSVCTEGLEPHGFLICPNVHSLMCLTSNQTRCLSRTSRNTVVFILCRSAPSWLTGGGQTAAHRGQSAFRRAHWRSSPHRHHRCRFEPIILV